MKSHVSRLENEVRRKMLEMRKEKLQRLKEQLEEQQLDEQIADLQDRIDGDDDEEGVPDGMNPDALIMSIIAQAMAKKQQPQAQPVAAAPVKLHLSDEQLAEYKQKIPSPVLKKLSKMSAEDIIDYGRQYVPDFFERVDDDTITRAVAMIQAK